MTSDTGARVPPGATMKRWAGGIVRAFRDLLREQRSLTTVLLMVFCILVGFPVSVLLTPDQEVTVAGQHLAVGVRTPSLSISGPAQLVQVGNTELDIAPLRVYGPLRPRLTLGPVQRNDEAAAAIDPDNGDDVRSAAVSTIAGAFLRWYLWATLILIAFVCAATAIAACVRILWTLRRQGHGRASELTALEIWHRSSGQVRGMLIGTLVVSLAAWAGAGVLAYRGAIGGLAGVSSLSQLVGTYYLSPSAVGPVVEGYSGAVIGDSRAARAGGPELAAATEDDQACGRSADSLAAQLGSQLQTPVLNLACTGASIASGLRGPQQQGGRTLPPQVGRLKQVEDLEFVVVVIGPNDLAWTDQLRYCYAVSTCQDNLTHGEFDYRLDAFDRAYGDLLHDLNDLPGSPQVIIVTSYDVFTPETFEQTQPDPAQRDGTQPDQTQPCADAKGPAGVAGLSVDGVRLLADRNRQLNEVLTAGAKKYEFALAEPVLTPLCERTDLGADIQGLQDSQPFHPTAVGMIRMASAVTRVVTPEQPD